ncbi:hypothetical protein HYW76_05370 [Candidatus Pacearchaeota archaeon]|nr:hypothetical protein [Candidatus Pacearchaeota archaeon]
MKLSQEKRDKISEQIVSFLYHIYPRSEFTSSIAKEIIRDEEFTKDLLLFLKEKNLVIPIKKNKNGQIYSRRVRWRISNQAHQAYSQQA